LGFSGDATVIFIPGQTQPEFVSLNATVDLFGRSFNVLEIGLSRRGKTFHQMLKPFLKWLII
jgi:hypothetical protein